MAGNSASTWYHYLGNNAVQLEASEQEDAVRSKYPKLLGESENILLAFKNRAGLGRDKSYFTSSRILIKDGKGIGSKRKNYVSIPYWSIQACSIETAGKWDGDVDLKVYSTGHDVAKIDFAASQVDIFAIQQFLNTKINWKAAQGVQEYAIGQPPTGAVASASRGSVDKLMDWLGDNAKQVDPGTMEEMLKNRYPILLEDEKVHMSFKSGRDYSVFTDTRYLLIDVQGIFGKKVEFTSFPWRSFSAFAVQTAGAYFDRDTELVLYTNIIGCPDIRQDFRKQAADIFGIKKYLSNVLLGKDKGEIDGVDKRQGHVDPRSGWWFRENQRPLDALEMTKYYHDVVPLLQTSEKVEMAFKGRRDITLFTTKRIIDIDPKGWKGVQIEYTSIPWESVIGFGVKTAGKHMDRDCEAMIYTDMMYNPGNGDDPPSPGMSYLEVDFNKDLVNILAIKRYLSARCLQSAPDIPVPQNLFMVSREESSGLAKFLAEIGGDGRAIDPTELDTALHTTHPILMDNERTIMAFKAGRDTTLFTSLRILIMDVQGWSGEKVEYTSIPYASIRAFSAESAGSWDRDAQVKVYTRNTWTMAQVDIDFRKGKADIIAIQKFLASIVLGNLQEAGKYLDSCEPIMATTNPAGLKSFSSFLTNHSKKIDPEPVNVQLHSDPSILLENERVSHAFRQGRDMFVYTNLRFLVVDVKGLRGTKIAYKSVPWQWCHGTEFETAGHMDRDAEIYLHNDIPYKSRIQQSILVKDFDIYDMHAIVYGLVE